MTTDKDFKRLVRSRMQKTGESYTAARSRLLARPRTPASPDYEKLSGVSDATIKDKTGSALTSGLTATSPGTCTSGTRCPVGGASP